MAKARPVLDRIMERVERSAATGCWLWTGKLQWDGYAKIKVEGRMLTAHRVVYELLVGPIPEGHQIDHVKARGCVHRHCCNPAHLEAVTPRENVMRSSGVGAVNAAKTHCPHGHPLDGDNLMVSCGGRCCRTCCRASRRRSGRRATEARRAARVAVASP